MGIELPAELAGVATAAGVQWPQADEEAMRSSAQAWRTAGTKIAGLAKDADGTANQALSAVQGDTGTAAKQHWNTFVAPDTGHLTSVVKGCTDAADRLDHAADQVGAAKVRIVRHLVSLAKNQDAANQAAAAGHPTALAGLTTTLHGTAASVAQVNHSLTTSIRLDNAPPGQPVHGITNDLLGSTGPLGPAGPISTQGPLGAQGLVGTHGPLGSNGPVNVVQPIVAPVTHGLDQVAGPVVSGPVGGHPGPTGGVLGLDPGHTGPVSVSTIGTAPGSPVLDGHGPLPTPPSDIPAASTLPPGPPMPPGPGDLGPVPAPGHAPELGVTVAQSAAPPVAPPAGLDQAPAGVGSAPVAPAEAPAAPAPSAASFSAPTPPLGTPMPSAPPPAPGSRSVPPAAPPQNQSWSGRGADDVVGAPVAVPRSGTASVRQGPRSAVVPPEPPTPVTGLPGFGAGRPKQRSDAVALFLVYLFPFGQLPKPTSRPARQLPPPAPETDFAAGLRFEPHDHPRSDLIDLMAALDHEPVAPAHPGFAAEDPEVAELADGHDPLGGGSEWEWDRRFLVRPPDPDGGQAAEYAWPPGELFPEGGCDAGEPVVLPVDTVIDRFGTPEGRVFAEDGTTFARRSLPPDQLAAGYRRYRVTQELPVWRNLSAAWFGQPGGGLRYRTVYPAADLVALGYLADITGTDNGH